MMGAGAFVGGFFGFFVTTLFFAIWSRWGGVTPAPLSTVIIFAVYSFVAGAILLAMIISSQAPSGAAPHLQ